MFLLVPADPGSPGPTVVVVVVVVCVCVCGWVASIVKAVSCFTNFTCFSYSDLPHP